jgi:hypothetical protein
MFRFTLLTLWLVAPAELLAQPKDSGDKSDFDKLFARCVDSSALVFAPEDRNEPIQRAGALVLNREKRLLLAPHTDIADEPTVVFPAYTSKGELLNKVADYADLWKKGKRWKGKVLHWDKDRDLVVIELDRPLPERARPAEFAVLTVMLRSTVYSLGQPFADDGPVWKLGEGNVRAVGKEDYIGRGPPPGRVVRYRVASTAPRGTGPECGLFNSSGHVVALQLPGVGHPQQVETRLDVIEATGFLAAKKVPFESAALDLRPGPGVVPSDFDPLNLRLERDSDRPAAGTTSAQEEKASTQLLSRARLFGEGDENRSTYILKLKQIIATYPGTAAAKEAQKILDRIK